MRFPELLVGLVPVGAAVVVALLLSARCSVTVNEHGNGDVAVSMQLGNAKAPVVGGDRPAPTGSRSCPAPDESYMVSVGRRSLEILFDRAETKSARIVPVADGDDLIGIRIESIEANSAYAVLGLQSGDVISCVDDMPLTGVTNVKPGELFSIHVLRGDQVIEINYQVL